ncbi:MAG: hypothetical protein K6G50_09235 [bacterium]|nr:hypothetical protein [bacterium]
MGYFTKAAAVSAVAICLFAVPVSAENAPEADVSKCPELYSILWQQTSACYKALCHQAYNLAGDAMRDNVRTGNYRRGEDGRLYKDELMRTPEGELFMSSKPLAIVLDLDETVFDNSPFEAWTCLNGKAYQGSDWNDFCRYQGDNEQAQRSVPGAVEFLLDVQKMGITPIYITDRSEKVREATLKTLRGLGLDTDNLNDHLVLQDKERDQKAASEMAETLKIDCFGKRVLNNSSKKAGRRYQVEQDYYVLGWFGDNFYDFPIYVDKTLKEKDIRDARAAQVEEYSDAWGKRFFILPCPMYGSWVREPVLPLDKANEALDDAGFGAYMLKNASSESSKFNR